MYLSNYHSHCTFCDGKSSPEDFVKSAISNGVKSYGFSSHGPLPFETIWTMKSDRLQDYADEISRLKNKYKEQIEIYLALEVDYLATNHNATSAIYHTFSTDYLISSIHYIKEPVSGQLLCIDGPYSEFEEGVNLYFEGKIEKVINTFFQQTLDMIELGGFDIVGHVDKIYMNGSKFAGFEVHQPLIDDWMEKVFEAIKRKEIMLEVNTKSYFRKEMTFPNVRHFSRMLEYQLPIVINCDSHSPHLVLDAKREVAELLYRIGFRSTKELVNGVWVEMELNPNGA